MTEETSKADCSVIADARSLIEHYLKPDVIDVKDPVSGIVAPAILSRAGAAAIPASVFDEYLEVPRYRRGSAKLTSLDSFIAHVNRFKSGNSAIFADDSRQAPKLTGVLDYHHEGAEAAPAFGRHRSVFEFPLSDEWKAWNAKNGEQMGMVEFAEFLEDRVIDVQHPSEATISGDAQRFIDTLGGTGRIATPSTLIELSQGLQVYENSVIKEATKLSSGEGQVAFQSEHTDAQGAPLLIPTMFLLAIPVFRNGPAYQVVARLRYRKSGRLIFFFELWRTDRVFDHAFSEACQRVQSETSAPLFLGSPEA